MLGKDLGKNKEKKRLLLFKIALICVNIIS